MMDCGGAKDRVLQRLESDLSSADMQWSLFMSALESYRHDSILRPFPSAYVEDEGNKNVQRLVSVKHMSNDIHSRYSRVKKNSLSPEYHALTTS